MSNPPRFEDEFPEVAGFLMRVFAACGNFEQKGKDLILLPEFPPIKNVEKYCDCPCGSGKKTKFCHKEWTIRT